MHLASTRKLTTENRSRLTVTDSYSGLNAVAFVMIFFFVPETKQRTLEELDYVFAVPTSTFARYQTTKALPYWIKRWVFFNRSARLEPLYHFDEGMDIVNEKNV